MGNTSEYCEFISPVRTIGTIAGPNSQKGPRESLRAMLTTRLGVSTFSFVALVLENKNDTVLVPTLIMYYLILLLGHSR